MTSKLPSYQEYQKLNVIILKLTCVGDTIGVIDLGWDLGSQALAVGAHRIKAFSATIVISLVSYCSFTSLQQLRSHKDGYRLGIVHT